MQSHKLRIIFRALEDTLVFIDTMFAENVPAQEMSRWQRQGSVAIIAFFGIFKRDCSLLKPVYVLLEPF